MAQRTIHYLFGELFLKRISLENNKRFLLGSVLPDAYANGYDRGKTHFIIKTETQVYFDFNMFREQYAELICKDDLYLGYYMHLVEDAFYRRYIYKERLVRPRNQEEVALLHNDYRILNSHIVNKYQLQNELISHVELKNEDISNVAEFRINEFLKDMSCDFENQVIGKTSLFTEEMVDEFIDRYVLLGLEELRCVRNGTSILQPIDFAWPV